MKNILIISNFVLAILLIIVSINHICYRMNVKFITLKLKEIIKIKDTNQLLTVEYRQKDILELVNVLNNQLVYFRKYSIHIKKLDRNFRDSITNISHDLRTPLTTAHGYIQMLQTDITEEEKQEYLSIILERQNTVKSLLDQLFEYVRIESGEIIYDCSSIDLRNIFIDTLTMYYDDFSDKGEEPVIIIPDANCLINGNKQALKRIFSNILFNALTLGSGDYIFELEENNSSYTFKFSNKSSFMTDEYLNCIFNRFYVQDKSRNKKTTGLGLFIVKEIVKQLNGNIYATYSDDIFTIYLSFAKLK